MNKLNKFGLTLEEFVDGKIYFCIKTALSGACWN